MRLRLHTGVHVRVSAFICVQKIKHLDTSGRKWISASERAFCSRTFGMYMYYTCNTIHVHCLRIHVCRDTNDKVKGAL